MSAETVLSAEHLKVLVEDSGISRAVIESRGYRTVTTARELQSLGFARVQWNVPGLLLPIWTTDGRTGELYVYRPDHPRLDRRGKVVRYEFPKGAKMRLDCPPSCRDRLSDSTIPLWVTEGQKKADALASRGLCAVALLGVWNFKGKNAFGGTTILADFDHLAFDGRDIRIVFDSDVMTKPPVRAAVDRLAEHLRRRKARVTTIYLPSRGVAKVGVDDYLLAHTVEDLERLIEAPRPMPKAAAPVVELLEEAPKTIRRPLSLIDGVAYAAIWPWVQVMEMEGVNSKGEVVRHNPPVVTREQRLVIIRGDGARFSGKEAEGMPSFADLGLDVRLPEVPPQGDRLWSTVGVKQYLQGYRPDPLDVFNRLADVVDRFIDFKRSLADQRIMAELIAATF